MNVAVNQGGVEVKLNNSIATITFFHPLSNSLPGKVLSKLAETITELGEDDSTKVIVLKSEGDRAFCAGASFDELINISDAETGKVFFSGFANVINAMRTCPKFIIGRIQGKAVGGGVGLAAAVDYCLATKFAAIKLSELAIGIGPFVIEPAVERKVGKSAFGALAINASEWRDANWALNNGLYTDVFETTELLDQEVESLADRLSKYNPEAMEELKKVLWKGTDHWDDLLKERAVTSGSLVLSEFTKNAITSFKKK